MSTGCGCWFEHVAGGRVWCDSRLRYDLGSWVSNSRS